MLRLRRSPATIPGRILEPVRFAAVMWAYIGLAFALGYAGPTINELFFPGAISPVDNASISAILSAIAAGAITLTGIVFSFVFVIVQFGTTAYSPRIARLFARSHGLGHALGIFTGGRERGFREDPRYALRLLADMAIRALSPAINDPTTAVQALDHIEMLLNRQGNAHLEIGEVTDDRGRVRIR